MKKAFTLLELLVVIALIGLLTGIAVFSLREARLRAKILVVNSDLRQVGLALECYFMDHKKYPPTREDCNAGSLEAHLYQLPKELGEGNYLPAPSPGQPMAIMMEDKFHPGHTYKYRSVGECIRDRNIIDRWIKTQLWVPDGFPAVSSLDKSKGQWYSQIQESPVVWTVFSLGPNFDEPWVWNNLRSQYPVPRETWYNHRQKHGFLVRLRMNNGHEHGSFEGNP
jgi:prepilin-type N-terminal cleavage/methylation domain-containing protein